MEDFKAYCNPVYKCGICGNEYGSVLSRAKCEIACAEKRAEEERKAAEAKKKEEQNLRKEAVDEAIDNAWRLVDAYVKDYGHYEYGGHKKECNMHWPSRLWHQFLY